MGEVAMWIGGYLLIGSFLMGVAGIEKATSLGVALYLFAWPLVLAIAIGAFIKGCFFNG